LLSNFYLPAKVRISEKKTKKPPQNLDNKQKMTKFAENIKITLMAKRTFPESELIINQDGS